jgi:hypothetical protein
VAGRQRGTVDRARSCGAGDLGIEGLVPVANHQDHARPQGGDVAVVLLQSGHGGVVGIGDRIQSLARLDLVMDHGAGGVAGRTAGRAVRRAVCCGRVGCGVVMF